MALTVSPTREQRWPDSLTREHIAEMLPHGPKAQYLDRAEIKRGTAVPTIEALRVVRLDDCNDGDHFPGNPVFPGHLWPEVAFLAAGVLVSHQAGVPVQGMARGANYENLAPAFPGDTIRVVVSITEQRRSYMVFQADGYIGDKHAFHSTQKCVGRLNGSGNST